MKKSILLVVIILFVSFSSALSTNIKEEYFSGETIIVKINEEVLEPVTKEQIEFKRENVRVPFLPDIKKIGSNYYISTIIPIGTQNGNYSLTLNDIVINQNSQIKEENLIENFSILNNYSSYSVNPGLIYTNKDFQIEIESYMEKEIEIDADYPYKNKIILKKGKNTLSFYVNEIYGTQDLIIKIGKYSIPAHIIGSATVPKKNIIFEPFSIKEIYLTGEKKLHYFIIKNNGREDLTNIQISYNKDIFPSSLTKPFLLKSGEEISLNFSLKDNTKEKIVNEVFYLQLSSENITYELPVEIVLTKNSTLINEVKNNSIKNNTVANLSNQKNTCNNLGGYICSSSQTCSGNSISSLEGTCCIGVCLIEEEESNSWVGYLIATLILLLLYLIYHKYKKIKPNPNPIKSKFEEFDNDRLARKTP